MLCVCVCVGGGGGMEEIECKQSEAITSQKYEMSE